MDSTISDETATATAPATVKPKTEVTKITMKADNREVGFAGKRKMVKDVIEDAEGNPVGARFDFINGESITLMFSEIPQKTALQLLAHGIFQKVGDESAGVDKVDDIVLGSEEMVKRLRGGEFYAARTAGDSFSGASIVIRALCNVTGKSKEDIKAYLDGKIEKSKGADGKATITRADLYKSLRNPDSKTGQEIAKLEREEAAKSTKVSASDLEAELGV